MPRRTIEYRGVALEEMDVDAILRAARSCASSTSSRTPTSPAAGTRSAIRTSWSCSTPASACSTAVNIQHLETLNDAVGRVTGVRVRETVPDTVLDRADEVVNVDVTVQELQSRLRQGKVYKPEKVEQALTNFFRETNLSTRCASWRSAPSPTRSATRRPHTGNAKGSSPRSFPSG